MINDYEKGGLKMSYNKSLKTTWVRKYLDDKSGGKWKLFFERELWKYGGKLLFRGNLNRRDTAETIHVTNSFISGLLHIWADVNYTSQINTRQQFLEQPLWHNSLIRIGNKPGFF